MDATRSEAPKKGICCVCKETKAKRDECLLVNPEEQCKPFINLHNECLRKEGFTPASN